MALQLSNASTKSIIDGDLEKEANLSIGEGRRLSKVAFQVPLFVGGRMENMIHKQLPLALSLLWLVS